MDNDGNKVVWTVVIISAIAIIGLMFVNFMPSQTSNIKTAIGNELSAFGNDHTSDSSSNKSSSSSSSSHTVVGTNLIQMANTTAGYVNGANGTIVGANSTQLERVTDFIEVEPNQTYWMQDESDLHTGQYIWFGVGVYDGNKTFITRPTFYGSKATGNITDFQKLKMVMPGNAKYVRASFRTYGNARVKLEKGSVATPWAP